MRHDPRALMLYAAGFGTRMGALTADRPKPLVPVAGRALIDHAMDIARGAGVAPVVVNLHYRGGQIIRHLAGQAVVFSPEAPDILETGGGLKQALPLLGPGPVFTLNSDAVWTGPNPLSTLRAAWRSDMQALLLLAPVAAARGHGGRADFALDAAGRIRRWDGGAGFVYLGAQIIRTEGLAAIGDRAFSIWRLWDGFLAEGTMYGVIHPGGWCDVGHPGGIAEAEALLREGPA